MVKKRVKLKFDPHFFKKNVKNKKFGQNLFWAISSVFYHLLFFPLTGGGVGSDP